MYHVIITGIISLIVYLLTLAGSRSGIITRRDHMAFWNIILFLTFVIVAAAGIFLALQSNYKWNVAGVEKILQWHVNFGVAMSACAIIHLTWNLSYYKGILKGSRDRENTLAVPGGKDTPAINFRLILLLLGFMTGTMQVIFLREILNLSGGYEIAAGAVFAFWIIISALGAKLAGNASRPKTITLMAILPLTSVMSFAIYILFSRILLEEGVTPGIIYSLIICGLSLIPFCLLSGYLFVVLSYNAARDTSLVPGNSFAIETAGSMFAGIMVTLLTGNILGNFQILFLAIFMYYIPFLLVQVSVFHIPGILIILAGMLAVIVFEPDTHIRNILLGSVKVIESRDSKYGNIAIGDYQGERSIFYDHRLIDYEQDEKQREENIHYAMLQHDEPRDVLIISGGSSKHIREVLKYKGVKTVSYLERDPELLALTRDSTMEYPGVDVRIVNDDAFSYIRKTDRKYDVIISLLTEPDNIVTNRFYTKEYFLDIKEILRPGGIFMLKAGVASSYISDEESAFISTVYNSLDFAFKNILPIKGESIYLLSSDSTLKTAITDLVSKNGLENTYVNSYYLNDEIISYSSQQVSEVIDESLPENLLDRPRAVFYKQRYQLNKAGSNRLPAIIIISVLLLLPFITGSNSARTMYSASLNLAGTEILALILIQSTAGNFYQLAGLLIAAVMGGLAAGSSARIYLKDRVVELSPVLLGLLAVLFALLSPRILEFQSGSIAVIISFALVIIPAILAGYYYRRKTEKDINSRTISGIYFADLCGAALGFMIIAGILVPFYGIKSTFFILAFLNFASYITNQVINGIRKLIY
ncbi:MAG: hypothetical protein ACQETA_05105 [Bacteroidota bacterium]